MKVWNAISAVTMLASMGSLSLSLSSSDGESVVTGRKAQENERNTLADTIITNIVTETNMPTVRSANILVIPFLRIRRLGSLIQCFSI